MGFLDKNPGGYLGYDAEFNLGGVYSINSASSGVVTDGLQLYIDAANKNTYEPYKPTISDLSNSQVQLNTVNLNYSALNKGYFTFSNSRFYLSTSIFHRNNGQEITVCAMIYPTALGGAYRDIIVNRSDSLYNWMLYQHTTDGSIQLHGAAQNKSTYIPNVNQWVYIVATVDTSGNYKLYANGNVVQTIAGFAYQTQAPNYLVIGALGTGGEPWSGNGAVYQVYSKALTQDEILKNFSTIRGRYGI